MPHFALLSVSFVDRLSSASLSRAGMCAVFAVCAWSADVCQRRAGSGVSDSVDRGMGGLRQHDGAY